MGIKASRLMLGFLCSLKFYFPPVILSYAPDALQGLAKLLADHASGCCREQKYDNYFGRKIAIDASMHIYQALVRR